MEVSLHDAGAVLRSAPAPAQLPKGRMARQFLMRLNISGKGEGVDRRSEVTKGRV